MTVKEAKKIAKKMKYKYASTKTGDFAEIVYEILQQITPHNILEGCENHQSYYCCPKCRNKIKLNQKYCDECGTNLDWSHV